MSTQEFPDPGEWRDAVLQGAAGLGDAAEAAKECRACRL
jgi:hypothetical protein